ncbi:YcaO-like family protein [Streptomyces massasporeus]|uniref:YcaO-like family protein n=1 Tax=Streptomyces massasporeus TaxID=67324 RepID=UPI0036B61C35
MVEVLEGVTQLLSPYGLAPAASRLKYSPGEPAVPAFGVNAGRVLGLLEADPLAGRAPGTAKDFAAAGTAQSLERARLLALAELLERYSATMAQDSDAVVRASAEELGDEAMDLASFPRLSAEEYASPGQRLVPPDPSAPIRWVRGWSLTRRRQTYVPAVVAWMGCVPQRPAERIWHPVSTGYAVHGDLRSAVMNALCECIERDMVSTVWLRKLPLPRLEVGDAAGLGQEAQAMLARFRRSVLDVPHLFDATSDLGVPTIYLVSVAPDSSRVATMVACAAGADPEQVLAKVLREAIAYRVTLHFGHAVPGKVEDFKQVLDGAVYMARPEQAKAFDFLLSSERRRHLSDLPTLTCGDTDAQLDMVVERLRKSGMEVVAVEVTTDEARDLGLSAVRVFVPQLVPLSFRHDGRFLGHPRLRDAPERLGYPQCVGEEINPLPQPFG